MNEERNWKPVCASLVITYLQTERQIENIKLLDVEVDTNGRLIVVTEHIISKSIDKTRLSDSNVSDDNTFGNSELLCR